MKKVIALFLAFALIMMASSVAPALAAKPTTVPCSFTLAAFSNLDPGESWWTGDGTIFHVRGRTASVGIFPRNNPALLIGEAVGVTDLDFNTKTGQGNAIRTYTMTFYSPVNYPSRTPAGVPNPFGIGTLEGMAVLKATSLYLNANAGDFTGLLVATHGTGDFENAKLMAELEGHPFTLPSPPFPPGTTTIRIFLTGELTFHE